MLTLNQTHEKSATPAEASPILSAAAVHLWWFSLRPTDCLETAIALLSHDEQQRGGRLRHPLAAQRFYLGRAMLRIILGEYLHLPPQHLQFAYTSNGKPYVPEARHIAFSLAHAGEVGLLAIACQRRVGVDVELTNRPTNWQHLARRCLPAPAYQAFQALPDQLQAMSWLWVCHEAFLKARGEASLRRLLRIDLPWHETCTGYASHFTMQDVLGQTWLVRDVSREGTRAALVVEGVPDADVEISIFDRRLEQRPLP
jgi:4'-phosphopantetheinyl transferase